MIRFTDFTEIQLISNSQIRDGIDKTGHSVSFGALRKKEEKKNDVTFYYFRYFGGQRGHSEQLQFMPHQNY